MSIVTLAAVGVIIASGDMEPADAYVSAPVSLTETSTR